MRTKQRLGVYAGSFDPLTVGHLWMVEQGVVLFDKLVVAVGINPEKSYTFSLKDRLTMLGESLRRFRNLSVTSFSNSYLIDYAQEIGATQRGAKRRAGNEVPRSSWIASTRQNSFRTGHGDQIARRRCES